MFSIRFVASVVAAAALSLHASASDDALVVTAFGGIWQQSIDRNFASCFKERTHRNVSIQLGDPAGWLNRVRANPAHPPIDVVTLPPADTVKAARAGMLEALQPARLPHLKEIPAANYRNFDDKAVQVHTAALGVLYNKQAVHDLPKDWKSLLDAIAAGKYGKRVSMPAGTYAWGPDFIWFVGHTYGGGVDEGFARIKSMAPSVVKFWTEPAEALNLFGTRQVDILLYWDGRSHDFISKGNDWAAYYNPAPKSLGTSITFAKVKNGNDAAWDFIDCTLSPKPELAHAQMLGYGVTNDTVVYPPELKAKITPADAMVFPPYGPLLDQTASIIDRWNREMR